MIPKSRTDGEVKRGLKELARAMEKNNGQLKKGQNSVINRVRAAKANGAVPSNVAPAARDDEPAPAFPALYEGAAGIGQAIIHPEVVNLRAFRKR